MSNAGYAPKIRARRQANDDYVLNRLVEAGNTVVVIEYNLEVIKNADWIIDFVPEGGGRGGPILDKSSKKQEWIEGGLHDQIESCEQLSIMRLDEIRWLSAECY